MRDFTTVKGRAQAEFETKKSRFISQIAPATSEEEALDFLEEVRADNRMARHNVYAYVLRNNGAAQRVRYSDDGEPQKTAGMPTLEVIRHARLTDICLVTTRYFGGILLGTGGLTRAYTKAAQAVIEAADIVTLSECIDSTVTVPYALCDILQNIAHQYNAKLIDAQYTDVVTLTFRLLAGTEQPFLDKLTELTRGNTTPTVSTPFTAAF